MAGSPGHGSFAPTSVDWDGATRDCVAEAYRKGYADAGRKRLAHTQPTAP